jgi:hypothetical protein
MTEFSTSPHCVLTVVRFANRSKSVLKDNPELATTTLDPLVIVNDCISCTVSEGKDGFTSSFTATLKSGDVNYLTAIHSGDYVLVNMVDSSEAADDVRNRAAIGSPINIFDAERINGQEKVYQNDGFKGLFKIQSVRRRTSISPNGEKITSFNVIGYSHYFFNSKMYFIPQLVSPGEKQSRFLFFASISKHLQTWFAARTSTNIQNTIKLLLDTFLGTEFDEVNKDNFKSPNQLYHVPPVISSLLGLKQTNRHIDLVNFILGPQQYNNTNSGANLPLFKTFNPDLSQKKGRIFETKNNLYGEDLSTPQQFNMVSIGEYIKGFINDVINEMYVCHRMDPVTGNILPTVVIREKPFTSKSGTGRTKYATLPTWSVEPEYVFDFDVGVEEAGRINFVQIYGRTLAQNAPSNTAAQIALENYAFDLDDIRAHGLRPYVTTSNFDWPMDGLEAQGPKNITMTPMWTKMVKDWTFGGHLKLNGTATLFGSYKPVVPGDNMEIDGVLFHIERITHSFNLSSEGIRTFRSQVQLSHGIESDLKNQDKSKYNPEMTNQNANPYKPDRYLETDTRVGPTQVGEEHNSLRPGDSVVGKPAGNRNFNIGSKKEGKK